LSEDEQRHVEHITVSIDELEPDAANVNEQTEDEFAALVKSIKEFGFLDPVLCFRKDGKLRIINGEHRWKAAKFLGYIEIPVAIVELDEDDIAHVLSIRMNYARGRLNPFKFTKLFNELRRKYDPETLRAMMGIGNEKVFKNLYRDVRAQLPPAVRRELDKTKQEITDVEDLARVIRNAVARYGHNLQNNFIFLEYGGRMHLAIKLSERSWSNVERIAVACEEHDIDINDYINVLLEDDDRVFNVLDTKVVTDGH